MSAPTTITYLEPIQRRVANGKSVAIVKATQSHKSPIVSLISGGVAGAVEATATYPFEFAKTRAQLQTGARGTRNPFFLLSGVIRKDGPKAIYTGCTTLILGTTFKASVRFLSFDSIKNVLKDDNGDLSPGRGILAGLAAGCVESVVAVTPTERIKTALIDDAKAATRKYHGGSHAFKTILAERGISELYRGLLMTTVKHGATSAVRMGSYNSLKELSRQRNIPQNSITTFGIGAVAGVITVYATQPFDTIKTMSQSAKGAGVREAFFRVVTTGGLTALWRGSTMRLGRLIFSGGIVFTVYENVSSLLTSAAP